MVRGAGEHSGARIHSSDRVLPPKPTAPDFLHGTLGRSAYAAFFKESRTRLFFPPSCTGKPAQRMKCTTQRKIAEVHHLWLSSWPDRP
jgi:hypothetical protein